MYSIVYSIVDFTLGRLGSSLDATTPFQFSPAALCVTLLPLAIFLILVVHAKLRRSPQPPPQDTNTSTSRRRAYRNGTGTLTGSILGLGFGLQHMDSSKVGGSASRRWRDSRCWSICRQWWRGMLNSHEMLSPFCAKQVVGMGRIQRLAILLAFWSASTLSGTLLFFVHKCFSVFEGFDTGSMSTWNWWLMRGIIVVMSLLMDMPMTVAIRIAFRANQMRMIRLAQSDSILEPHGAVLRRCSGKCTQLCPWILCAAQSLGSLIFVFVLTSKGFLDGGESHQLVPCFCSVGFQTDTSLEWVGTIALIMFFWAGVSRPLTVLAFVVARKCGLLGRKGGFARRTKPRTRKQQDTELIPMGGNSGAAGNAPMHENPVFVKGGSRSSSTRLGNVLGNGRESGATSSAANTGGQGEAKGTDRLQDSDGSGERAPEREGSGGGGGRSAAQLAFGQGDAGVMSTRNLRPSKELN